MEVPMTKVCDYCTKKGEAYTFLSGETICSRCLAFLPKTPQDSRLKMYEMILRIRSLEVKLTNIVGAAKEVIRISDRKHDAWDRLKEVIR